MPDLFPHQLAGAQFLASRRAALLADEQRVGKTPASIRACDYVMARRILVVTKSSAREQWGYEFRSWGFPRNVQVIFSGSDRVRADADVVVVGWGMVYSPNLFRQLVARRWDVLLSDECHEAKNPNTKRTVATFGQIVNDGVEWDLSAGLASRATYVWPLSGTPVPNAPNDLYPFLRSLAPERLKAGAGGPGSPDVTVLDDFTKRYCVSKLKRINGVMRLVHKGGKNLEELNTRVDGLWLRRTQADVGIKPPIFSIFALTLDEKLPPELTEVSEAEAVFAAIETGETKTLEMHLGPLRMMTGLIKANAVIKAATELLEDRQIDKLVLMAWHTPVVDALWRGLARFGVCGVDGRTPPKQRYEQARMFREDANRHVFVGQIIAAGEAIDLSAAADLWFVEPSFVPKDMSQAAMRITHHHQKRQPLVRVCALAGSIDEALMANLTRKVASIRQLMENAK